MGKINSYFISSLVLNTFRNYNHCSFDFKNCSHIIYGENGIGKTNILEAISMLGAGRGLRNTSLDDIVMTSCNSAEIIGRITSNLGEYDLNLSIDFSLESNNYKKKYFLDGSLIKNKNLLIIILIVFG